MYDVRKPADVGLRDGRAARLISWRKLAAHAKSGRMRLVFVFSRAGGLTGLPFAWTDLMPAMSRRHILAGLAVSTLDLPAFAQAPDGGQDGFRVLRAYQHTITLPDGGSAAIWGFDGTATGPALRIKRGEELRIRLINDLPEPTVLHWHGVRLPNAMDGVP